MDKTLIRYQKVFIPPIFDGPSMTYLNQGLNFPPEDITCSLWVDLDVDVSQTGITRSGRRSARLVGYAPSLLNLSFTLSHTVRTRSTLGRKSRSGIRLNADVQNVAADNL
jgi:hypothetical protein